MKYDSDIELGKLTDEIDNSISQDVVTENALRQKDREDLIDLVSKRTTETTLKYYFITLSNPLEKEPVEYWVDVMKSLVKYYHLMSLKVFLSDSFIINNYEIQVQRILKYLKTNLVVKIIEKTVTNKTTRDELEKIFSEDEDCPFLLKWGIKFIDRQSYDLFINVVFDEFHRPFEEENE